MSKTDIPVPTNYNDAMSGPDKIEWTKAMASEFDSLKANNTYVAATPPPGIKPIPCKWVYTLKTDAAGNVTRYKARIVVKGFYQREGLDFTDTFAPVSRMASVRTALALANYAGWEIHQLDVKTAFLQGTLTEDVWVAPPPGSDAPPGMVWHLNKALYGLKQAPRAWHQHMCAQLIGLGYTPLDADPSIFIRGGDNPAILVIYVDDFAILAKKENMNNIKKELLATFDARDLGEASLFLGLHIQRDRKTGTLLLNQERYIIDLATEYGQLNTKPKFTPFASGLHLRKEGQLLPNPTVYMALTGSLNYAAQSTRPDIAFHVGVLTRFMAAPTTDHMRAAIGVLRYLYTTKSLGITYSAALGFTPISYCDADYASDLDTRRSTSGYVTTLGGGAVQWGSRLQKTVSTSTAEAEYVAASAATKETMWLRMLLRQFGTSVGTFQIYTDNQAALTIIKNPVLSMRSKHIDIAYHFTRERVASGEVVFTYIPTDQMVADCLTKVVPLAKHQFCCKAMGMY